MPTQAFDVEELELSDMMISAAFLTDMYSKLTCLTALTFLHCFQKGNEDPHLVPASRKLRYKFKPLSCQNLSFNDALILYVTL